MEWIKWRLLPFIMLLFFLGGAKTWRLCSTLPFCRAVAGAGKCLVALRTIEKTFTLHNHFLLVTGFSCCLAGLRSSLFKLFSRRCFGRRRQTCASLPDGSNEEVSDNHGNLNISTTFRIKGHAYVETNVRLTGANDKLWCHFMNAVQLFQTSRGGHDEQRAVTPG